MKDMTQRAPGTPAGPVTRGARADAKRDNTLTRISLALTQNFAIDDLNRGSDPYNTTAGAGRAEIWQKQRLRR